MALPDLNDMLYFAEVVQQGGFAAAGRRLNLPKSKLSRRVAELEDRLGVRLLHRTTRKLHLTDAGETYLRHCLALREQAQAGADAMAQAKAQPSGLLRVACPVSVMHSPMGDVFTRYLQRYPDVRLDLRISNRAVDLVEEGFDLALRVRAVPEDSATLVMKSFGLSHTLLVASPGQLQRQGRPAEVQDLALLDAVAMQMAERGGEGASGARSHWLLIGPEGKSQGVQVQPRAAADDLLALKGLALAGIGMAVLPDYLVRDELARGELQQVLPGWEPMTGIFHAVFPSRRGMLPSLRALLDMLDAHVREDPCAEAAFARKRPGAGSRSRASTPG